ncbi:MAG: hypothetical protein IT310_06615 [Anaerolineales bacterium]|nr:hypothetical protein [Anaerolineales bacterium]
MKARSFCISALLALCVGVFFTTPALADDGAPPVVSTETPVVVTETPTVTETPAASPEAPSTEEVAPVETTTPPTDEESQPPQTTPEALPPLPEDTSLIVTDENGESIPLATQEAADVIKVTDPIWCPTGIAPKANVGGCSNSYNNLWELIEALTDGSHGAVTLNKNGTIWIEKGNLNDNTWIVFDGTDPELGNMENYSLTFQGGWNGVPGSKLLDAADPYSHFENMGLSILNWKGIITINNLDFNIQPGSGTTNPVLLVESSKSIILNNVTINGNDLGQGARLDTTAAPAKVPASVTVTNSIFSNNQRIGLYIKADGAVTLKSVTAIGNGQPNLSDYGVYIDNQSLSNNLNQPVTITGANWFTGNKGTGLAVYTSGAVTISNVTAYGNTDGINDGVGDAYGVYIKNNYDSTASNVSFTGTNLFNNNQINGLYVSTNGAIALSSVTAEYNGNSQNDAAGVYLDTCLDVGAGCTTVAKSVTLTGVNNFRHNQDFGLKVIASGFIKINQVTANYNGNTGVDLDNCRANGGACKIATPQYVYLTGINTFIGNDNGGDGLHILTTGYVTLGNLTANANAGDGVEVINNVNLLSAQPVTIGGVNTFNNNDANGLLIQTYGQIKVYSLTASDNLDHGAYLDNRGWDGAESKLKVRANIYVYGTNRFDRNGDVTPYSVYYGDNGFTALSAGTVLLYNLSASDNYSDGVFVSNIWAWKPVGTLVTKLYTAPITLYGYGYFAGNGDDGLEIDSKGAVSLINLTAESNGDNGVDITAAGEIVSVTPPKVTLAGTNYFYKNGFGSDIGSGLYVVADLVTANSLTASGNRIDGAYFDVFSNVFLKKYLGLTLTGINTFQGNGENGLNASSQGNIVLSRVDAFGNAAEGVHAWADRNLTYTCGNTYNNNRGFSLHAGGSPDPGTGILTLKYINGFLNTTSDDLAFTTLVRAYGVCP